MHNLPLRSGARNPSVCGVVCVFLQGICLDARPSTSGASSHSNLLTPMDDGRSVLLRVVDWRWVVALEVFLDEIPHLWRCGGLCGSASVWAFIPIFSFLI